MRGGEGGECGSPPSHTLKRFGRTRCVVSHNHCRLRRSRVVVPLALLHSQLRRLASTGLKMTDDLIECRARAKYVLQEVKDLQVSIDRFHARGLETRLVPGGIFDSILEARLDSTADVPIRRKIGDIITESRSNLNALAKVLMARARTEGRGDFPLPNPDKPDGYKKVIKPFLEKITEADRERFKPHEGEKDILVQLSIADNARKHERLTMAAAISGGFAIFDGDGTLSVRTIQPAPPITEEWTQVCYVGGRFSKPIRPRFTMSFSAPKILERVPVTMWLEGMANSVWVTIANFEA